MITDFINFALEHGLIIDNIIADGKIHRVPLINSKAGHKDGSYCFYDDVYGIGGWIKNFKTGEYCKFFKSTEHMYKAKISFNQSIEKKSLERKNMYNSASQTAEYLVNNVFTLNIHHPYLSKKQVKAYGTYTDKYGALIIPLKNIDGKIRSFQRIDINGNKSFLKNSEVKGNFFKFGKTGDVAFVCEGYATGASLYEATGIETYSAMSANNIEYVVDALKNAFEDLEIIIAGDADENGKKIAIKTAEKYNCSYIIPPFDTDEIAKGLTDFNDFVNTRNKDMFNTIIKSFII